MAQKLFLFILGLPGSGKSTIACYIVDYFRRKHEDWSALRLCDYDILYSMFQEDKTQENFYPTEHGGFYVKNPLMYDKALQQLEMEIENCEYAENTLIIIEFARSDYMHAFTNFSPTFLQDAYFLFLDVDIETGMKRVRNRVKHPHNRDDHFVSEYTFEFYRQKDTAEYLSEIVQHFTKNYLIQPQRIKILHNNEELFKEEVGDEDSIMEAAFTLV